MSGTQNARIVEVNLKGEKHKIELPESAADLNDLRDLLAEALHIDARGLTIISKGKRLGPELADSLSSLGEFRRWFGCGWTAYAFSICRAQWTKVSQASLAPASCFSCLHHRLQSSQRCSL